MGKWGFFRRIFSQPQSQWRRLARIHQTCKPIAILKFFRENETQWEVRERESRKIRVVFLRADNKMDEIVSTRLKFSLKSRFDNIFWWQRRWQWQRRRQQCDSQTDHSVNANKIGCNKHPIKIHTRLLTLQLIVPFCNHLNCLSHNVECTHPGTER